LGAVTEKERYSQDLLCAINWNPDQRISAFKG